MQIDWLILERLRQKFLAGTAGAPDYWQSTEDLAQYDRTFAQRIGWKWDFVLDDLAQLGWGPPTGNLVDWGCGSGIAHRAFLDHFGFTTSANLHLVDRSTTAVQFAARRAREKYPRLTVHEGLPESIGLLLISHVATELTQSQLAELERLALHAQSVIWVEPGTYEASLILIAMRERLRKDLHIAAPCPTQNRCGILSPGNESHWCHQFASPPPFVFTDAFWGAFSKRMEIDLRSLPLSYLVMGRQPAPRRPTDAVRALGRPRFFKAHAELLGCGSDGVCFRKVIKRDDPTSYRLLKKGHCPSMERWTCLGDRITSRRPLDSHDGGGENLKAAPPRA